MCAVQKVMSCRFTNCYLINFIVNSVDTKYKVFSDLPGGEAAGGGTISCSAASPAISASLGEPMSVPLKQHWAAL